MPSTKLPMKDTTTTTYPVKENHKWKDTKQKKKKRWGRCFKYLLLFADSK